MCLFVLIDWSNLTNNYLKMQEKTIKKLRNTQTTSQITLFITKYNY
jgi:hypothetical protein